MKKDRIYIFFIIKLCQQNRVLNQRNGVLLPKVVDKYISSEATNDFNEIIGTDMMQQCGHVALGVGYANLGLYGLFRERCGVGDGGGEQGYDYRAAAQEKLNYATFGVGSTYSWFSKSFMVASLTCIHDIMLEIPLAHCVRGGMVRFADGRVEKRRAASENVPLPVTSSSPPFFFPFCLLVRNTIPRNVTTLSGISSVWQQTSKKCSLT